MELSQWLKSNSVASKDFGETIGVDRVSVERYKAGTRLPSKLVLRRIFEATDGQVTPNDFYLSEAS